MRERPLRPEGFVRDPLLDTCWTKADYAHPFGLRTKIDAPACLADRPFPVTGVCADERFDAKGVNCGLQNPSDGNLSCTALRAGSPLRRIEDFVESRYPSPEGHEGRPGRHVWLCPNLSDPAGWSMLQARLQWSRSNANQGRFGCGHVLARSPSRRRAAAYRTVAAKTGVGLSRKSMGLGCLDQCAIWRNLAYSGTRPQR